MSKKIVSLVFIALSLPMMLITGCAIPVYESTTNNVDQEKDEGYIRFVNVTRDHEIFIDGASIGSGETYNDSSYATRGVLALSPGTHLVEVTKDGNVLYKRKIFLSTGTTKSVNVQ